MSKKLTVSQKKYKNRRHKLNQRRIKQADQHMVNDGPFEKWDDDANCCGDQCKHKNLPIRFQTGFIDKLDKRTATFSQLQAAYDNIVFDLGGAETMTHIQHSMVERFVFLEFITRFMERKMANDPECADVWLGRWTHCTVALKNLAKTLGVQRKTKTVDNLEHYVASKKRKLKNGCKGIKAL